MSHEVHRAVISRTEAAQVRAVCVRAFAEIAAAEGLEVATLPRLISAWERDQPCVRRATAALAPRVKAALDGRSAAQLGDPMGATLFVVTGAHDAGTHAHQDLAYAWRRPVDERYAYTSWIALDACDARSGALRFADVGEATVAPRQDFLRRDFVDLASTDQWRQSETVVEAAPGDVVVFDALAWHASAAVHGTHERMALAIRWRSSSRWEANILVEPPDAAPGEFGMDTSGDLLRAALLDATGDERLPDAPIGDLVSAFLDEPSPVPRMAADARAALEDLAVALRLAAHHQARTSAGVWRRVRDVVLPALGSLSMGGAA